MIIEFNFGNDYFGNLVIENYPNLEKIVVKKNSLQNLNSLKICNNDKLKTIEVEDSAFENVQNVIIESIFEMIFQFISSYSTIIQNRKRIIQENNKFIFIKYDYHILNQLTRCSIHKWWFPFSRSIYEYECWWTWMWWKYCSL